MSRRNFFVNQSFSGLGGCDKDEATPALPRQQINDSRPCHWPRLSCVYLTPPDDIRSLLLLLPNFKSTFWIWNFSHDITYFTCSLVTALYCLKVRKTLSQQPCQAVYHLSGDLHQAMRRRIKAMFKNDTHAKATLKMDADAKAMSDLNTQKYLRDLYDSMARSQAGRPSLNPQLCAYCQNICQHWPTQLGVEEIQFFPYYGSKKDLFISARSCALCDRIAEGGFEEKKLESHTFEHSFTEGESPWRWGSEYNPAGSEYQFKVGSVEVVRLGTGSGGEGGCIGARRECPEQGYIKAYIPPDEERQSLRPSTPDGSFLHASALVHLVPSACE